MSVTLNSMTPFRQPLSRILIEQGKHPISLETGHIASQATSTIRVQCGDTIVIVPLVAMPKPSSEVNFLPLSVHYGKRKYADGQVPGARDRREGRPTTAEALTSRLIDRPLRAVFPKGFYNEVQITPTVVSSDPNIKSDILAMLGASAALALSGLPCPAPVASVRVGYIDGAFVLNPTEEEMQTSKLDLVIAGTEAAILMVEAEADALTKDVIIDAILFGHEKIKAFAKTIGEFAANVGKPKWVWEPLSENHALTEKVKECLGEELNALHQIQDKIARKEKHAALREKLSNTLLNESEGVTTNQLDAIFKALESQHMKATIIAQKTRLDGRSPDTIRPIHIEPTLLPRAHGSVLFTRGDTQALVTATLGSERDAELVDGLDGITRRDTFILHYNFPPYCVGEVGQMGSPKRREIGHANLAKRAMRAVLPDENACPYVLRVVSDIMSADGSSSMATVCGTSVALMDAGIALKEHVAGIAMGLVKQGDTFVVLSDISEVEDHIGDMDLKITGTQEGITAMQMDIKTDGITREILEAAITQAQQGIKEILGKMNQVLPSPRQKVSPYAPQIMDMTIPVDKIQALIGKGGATIRSITEETGTLIDIHRETGTIRISSPDIAACEAAIERVKEVTETGPEPEVGVIYEGTVVKILQVGAIVSILPGRRGLVHISEMELEDANQAVGDILQEKQRVRVRVLRIDYQKNKIQLTMKNLKEEDTEGAQPLENVEISS